MLILAWLLGCSDPVEGSVATAVVNKGAFEARLVVPGELDAVKSESISAPNIRGTLKILSVVEEGKRVKAGEVLVEFDRSDFERDLESELSKLEVARTRIAQDRAQLGVKLTRSQSEVTDAELALRRAQMRVTESETVPRVERETAKIDVEGSTLALDRSRSSLESTRLEGEAELELLRLEEAEAAVRVTTLRSQLDKLTIRAPSDGIVILVEAWRAGKEGKVTAGDTVWSGNPLMELPDLSSMQVAAWVHEVDATRVRAGQPARILVEAFPDKVVTGKVERVADLAVEREPGSEVKYLEVSVALDATDPALKPGMSVRVDLLLESLPDVVSAPREAVAFDGAEAFVWQQEGGDYERRVVKLGATNDTHVVVTEGLVGGEVVALTDPTRQE